MDAASDPHADELRQLALVDRIIGLEARLAEASSFASPSRGRVDALETEVNALRLENDRLRRQLADFRSTRTWKAGRLVLSPFTTVARLRRR